MATGFVDEVRLSVHAGDGGAGMVSSQRQRFRPKGGPDGGDGGRGGSIELQADPGLDSLARYVRRRSHRAEPGGRGGPNRRKGADAEDLVLDVPVGTVVRDAATGEILADLARPGIAFVVARGGRGGRGNAALRSSHDRAPNYAEQGEPGEAREIVLELRLVADVGLLGPPNAGKSTLLSSISRAAPKIADYPFTTLEPGLGVVEHDDVRFVAADLPGLIEGASEGKGLGLRFLRHAERCSVLAVVVDLAGDDPAGDLDAVVGETASYDTGLPERVRVAVGNKIDLDEAKRESSEKWAAARDVRFLAVSALEGRGLEELVRVLSEEVAAARVTRGEAESFAVYRPVAPDRVEVVREDDAFRVRSERAERLVAQFPLGNPQAVRRLQRRLRGLGVESALRREGVKEGDEVRIGSVAFEYVPEV